MLRIIDSKRIDLTDSEFKVYEGLCSSYDRPNFEGKDLFTGLFETDEHGMIIFLKPPGNRYISLEIVTFLQNIMVHQHLRKIYNEVDEAIQDIKKQSAKVNTEVVEVSGEIVELRKDIEGLVKDVKKLLGKSKKSSK